MKIILVSFLCLAAASAFAQTPPRYVVTDLTGQMPPATAAAYGVNDKTEVVGVLDGRPFLWRKGNLTFLSFNGSPKAINNRSQVIGTLILQRGSTVEAWKPYSRGVLSQNGKVTRLGVLPGGIFSSGAEAINASGDIVGYSATLGFGHAFLYSHGKMVDLGVPPRFDSSSANGINSSGEIVAYARVMSPPYLKAGFLWKSGKWQLLSMNVVPIAINDNGTALGYRTTDNAKRTATATACFLWRRGSQTPIGSFTPKAINNREEVVGYIAPETGARRQVFGNPNSPPSHPFAVLWKSGRLYRLDALVPKSSGWQIISANGINNRGEIVGGGIHKGKVCAVLLRPVAK